MSLVQPGIFAAGSFVAVQQWQHDLDRFAAMARAEQDAMIGRRRDDNEEIGEALATGARPWVPAGGSNCARPSPEILAARRADQPNTCFMTGIMRRAPATAVALASPPIIAPLTPQDMMSCPVSHRPGTFVRGRSQRWRMRAGSWSRP